MKRLWGRETRRGERNLIGKVVSSGDGCLCAVKVEVDGNQSRLKWRERERKIEDGRDQRGHSCPVVCLAC